MPTDSLKKILHITPHLGGGVGRVLLNYFGKTKKNPNSLHKVLCLEYANDEALKFSRKTGFSLMDKMSFNRKAIVAEIAKADIVLIHWWNHPLLYDFLVREKFPSCRLIIWSHISGFHPPYIFTKKILQYPDLFVFTTPISLKTKEVSKLTSKQKNNFRVVWSTGGIEHVKSVKSKKHSGFNIGYIGTVDYVKLHHNFLKICEKINIPDVKFIVCGGPSEREIRKEAEKMGIAKKFNFTGQISNIKDYLSIFDVFGYPLALYHYGTCDQSLQESMAAGVVPVVLNNPMEKHMIKNGVTGIVAKSENDYIRAIQVLYRNKRLRNSLSENAREYAFENFSTDKMAKKWDKIFQDILEVIKTPKKWEIAKKEISAMDVFLESLGDYGKEFVCYCQAKDSEEEKKTVERIKKMAESASWQVKTKGTIHHYHSFFPRDKNLSFLSRIMRENNSNRKI